MPRLPEAVRLSARKATGYRWPHPIGQALYGVIIDKAPSERVAAIVSSFVERRDDELERFLQEIQSELNDPTQQVRDILDCRASEQELREYLRLFCDQIERTVKERRARTIP